MPEPTSPAASPRNIHDSPTAPDRAGVATVRHGSHEHPVPPQLRKLAKTLGVNLPTLMASSGTRLRRPDILRARTQAPETDRTDTSDPADVSDAENSPMTQTTMQETNGGHRTPAVTRLDYRASLATSAQLTQVHEVDAGRLSEWARKLSGAPGGNGTVPNIVDALLLLAVAATLQEHPVLNAQYNQDRREITYHAQEHITFAATGEDHREGLVPFAGTLTVGQAAAQIAAIKTQIDRPEASSARPEPTFTVMNIGAVGALFESPIIVQPQVAILALGAITKRLVVQVDPSGQETIVARPMMYLSLTYDHRLVDGADAGRFLQALTGRLTSPAFYTSLT